MADIESIERITGKISVLWQLHPAFEFSDILNMIVYTPHLRRGQDVEVFIDAELEYVGVDPETLTMRSAP